eukprot:TRINITY_DN1722_c0_g1_i2.p1 TRINITY_DN1722_c0_g1~~TRINITY_DN1722_c0_g1_i2.p1  ORF type:complete len:203 (-),score=13.11 TRINITY_DN1722_c0_g1_i2:519-1127(-)
MRWSDAVVKACLSMGCVIGLMLLAISFDVGSIQQLYFSETVIRVELPHHTAPSLPWSLDEGDEDSLVVQNNTSMRKCFKNVPRHNGRCGYYANIVESMKSGTTALWNLMQQHQRLGGRTVHCSFKDYSGCLVQANTSPAAANIDKGPVAKPSLMTCMNQRLIKSLSSCFDTQSIESTATTNTKFALRCDTTMVASRSGFVGS